MKLIKSLLLFICLITANRTQAQWIQTNGPYGGDITCFTADSTTIYAGTYGGGVFRSTNNGLSWSAASTGLTNTNITTLAISGKNIIAGTYADYYAGIFISTDDGSSWWAADSGLTNDNITCLVVTDTNIFAGTANGLFRSTNNGTSWAEILSASIGTITLDGKDLLVGAGQHIFRSTNDGMNWTEIDSGINGNFINALVVSGTDIFAGTSAIQIVPIGGSVTPKGGVYISTNDGASWSPADSGLPNIPVATLAVKDGNIFAGGSDGIYRSTNDGTSWIQINSGLTSIITNAFLVMGTNLFAGTDNGVFISSNDGTVWSEAGPGIINISISAIGAFGSNVFAGDYGILMSTNNGASWNQINSGLPQNMYISSFVQSGSNIFAAMEFYPGILRSTDNGGSWSLLDTGSTGNYFTCLAASGNNLFVGQAGHGIFLSTDNGASWTAVNSGLSNTWVYSLAVSSNGNIFAGTQNGGVFLSTNEGKSWILPGNDLSKQIVYSIAAIGTKLFAATNNSVYLSTNNGTSWTVVGPKNLYATSLAVDGTNLFAAGTYTAYSYGGVFLTTDDGMSWTEVDKGMTNTNISSLVSNKTNLFAGTYGSGTWTRPLSEMITSVKVSPGNMPGIFSLEQNFPNPFNPSTTIQYQIPKSGLITIKIYDELGREVKTIVNQYQSKGNHEISFNASNLSSGVYFYQLKAGSFISTKEMLLLK